MAFLCVSRIFQRTDINSNVFGYLFTSFSHRTGTNIPHPCDVKPIKKINSRSFPCSSSLYWIAKSVFCIQHNKILPSTTFNHLITKRIGKYDTPIWPLTLNSLGMFEVNKKSPKYRCCVFLSAQFWKPSSLWDTHTKYKIMKKKCFIELQKVSPLSSQASCKKSFPIFPFLFFKKWTTSGPFV